MKLQWIFVLYSLLIIFCVNNIALGFKKKDYEKARRLMVETQIKERGINDPKVLRAMNEVPRHMFIPSKFIEGNNAYDPYGDYPVPIGNGQTISQPYIVALMTELLKLDGKERVLEIGTGSGYQAAILSRLCKEVYTIEIVKDLADWVRECLKGYPNVFVKHGDGYKGWKEKSPFDAIIVTCAPDHIPQPLIDQLAFGGRMVIPVGDYPKQELILLEKKKDGTIIKTPVIPVLFVPMKRE